VLQIAGYPAIFSIRYPAGSGTSNPVSSRLPDIKEAVLSGRISGASLLGNMGIQHQILLPISGPNNGPSSFIMSENIFSFL
jgi:hypothetical protein